MNQVEKRPSSSEQQATTQTATGDKVITFWQAATLLPSTLLGVGILTLPRSIAQATGTSGFMVVLVSGLFSLFIVWMITKLGRQFPGMTFVGYTQKIFTFDGRKRLGYWLALPFMLIVTSWWVMAVAIVVRLFGELQHSVVLPNTPVWFEVGTMLVVSMFVASNKAEVIGRLNEFLFPIIIVPLFAIGLLALKDAEWTNLLPLFDMTWSQFWRGVMQGLFTFQGVSILFIFMASYQQPHKAFQAHTIGIGGVMLIYLLVTMASMAVFSHEEVKELTWPVLELVENTRIPGLILERIEAGFLILWVVAVFTTLANLLTATVHLMSEYVGIEEEQRIWITLPLVVAIYIIALWPSDVYAVFAMGERVQLFGLIFALVIPPLLLLIALARRLGNGKQQNKSR